MKALLKSLPILIVSALIAAIYGAFHDFVTYQLSPDYYEHFKFEQFHAEKVVAYWGKTRAAMMVGIAATWWFGVIIGLAISLFWYTKNPKALLLKTYFISIALVFVTSIFCSSLGFVLPIIWNDLYTTIPVPAEIQDPNAFIRVGMLHNFSYLGGIVGTLLAGTFLRRQKRKQIQLGATH